MLYLGGPKSHRKSETLAAATLFGVVGESQGKPKIVSNKIKPRKATISSEKHYFPVLIKCTQEASQINLQERITSTKLPSVMSLATFIGVNICGKL